MTSLERVKTALDRNEPDRVPVLEFVVDQKVAQAIHPAGKDIGDLTEFLDLDGVGCGARFERRSISPDRYVDEWGVTYMASEEAVDLPKYVHPFKAKRAVLFHHRAAFMWSAYLMGLDTLLMGMMIEPELVEAVMDVVLATNIAIVRRAIRTGADMIVLGDDYASNTGPLMSPKLFGKFILPRLQKMVDALNPIEPVARMDIGEVKRKFGGQVCLIGNIDCSHLLTFGTPDEVRRAVRACIAASPGGGHMVSSSNSIHSGVKPENYVAMEGRVRLRRDDFQNPNFKRHDAFGWQYRLPEVAAAIGLAQLERLDTYVTRRQAIAKLYAEAIEGCDYLIPQAQPEGLINSYYTYAMVYEGEEAIGVSWADFRRKYIEIGRRMVSMLHGRWSTWSL